LTRHHLSSSIHKTRHGSLRRNNVGEGSSLSPCGWLDRDGGWKVRFGRLFVVGLSFLGLRRFLGVVLGLLGWSFHDNRLLNGHGGWGRRSQEGGGVASRYGTVRGGRRAGGGGRGGIGKAARRAAFLLAVAQHLVVDLFHLEGLGIPVARGRKRGKVKFSHGWWFQGHLLGSGFGTIVGGRLFVGHVLAVSSFGCVAPALLVVLRFVSGVGVDTAAAVIASSLVARPLLSGIVASSIFGDELRRVHSRYLWVVHNGSRCQGTGRGRRLESCLHRISGRKFRCPKFHHDIEHIVFRASI
jgi:hypothetical protein